MIHAVLADIHANLAALNAVLSDARKAGAEHLVLLGDYVGYYYRPADVIDRLMEWPHLAVRGNHDRYLLEARSSASVRENYLLKYGHGLEVALQELAPAAWRWIESLPSTTTVKLGDFQIELCHGSPFDEDRYVYPDSSTRLLDRCLVEDRTAVWMGHTHWPFMRAGMPWLLNPGSVGQPRDIGGLASWCLFDDETGSVAFRRSEFETAPLQAEVRRLDPALDRNAVTHDRNRLLKEGKPCL